MSTAHETECYCHGCGATIVRAEAIWHDGEPYCAECDTAPAGFCFLCGEELDATAINVDVSEIGESGISHRDCIDEAKARRAEQRNNQRGE